MNPPTWTDACALVEVGADLDAEPFVSPFEVPTPGRLFEEDT